MRSKRPYIVLSYRYRTGTANRYAMSYQALNLVIQIHLLGTFVPKTPSKESRANEQVRMSRRSLALLFYSAIFYNSDFMLFDRM